VSYVDQAIDGARDAAQQVVTALVYNDRALAAKIAEGYPDPLILALVLADLTAHVHHLWADTVGAPPVDGWQTIMVGIEDWRTGRGATT
jgi:hypothetical protein